MPAITYSDFSGGLDRRLPINVQEASRLWTLRNAYITTGKRIRKRPGFRRITDGMDGSFGLEAVNGELKVFVDRGSSFSPPVFPGLVISKVELDRPPTASNPLAKILYADLFQGYLYVVAEYSPVPVQVFHHYVDTNPTTYIADVNCPNSVGVTKAASRIFAPSAENVRYCAAGNARDWTTANDAGFLPAGLQQDTKGAVTGCGTFQDALVAFFAESAQIWDVAVDPSANKIRRRLYGTGTLEPLSLAAFSEDLMFLSPHGFRSMRAQQSVDRIDDTDVGVPVDGLVKADIEANSTNEDEVLGVWIHQLGQYWAFFGDMNGSRKAWVYSYSKTSKLASWSEYTLPFDAKAVATLNGRVFVRSTESLYEMLPDLYNDAEIYTIPVEVQMAFQDAKTPGVAKQVYGADYVMEGSPSVAFKYDPRDQAKETVAITIPGDTRPGDMLPVEVVAPAIAPVFRHEANEAFEIDAVTLYYNLLGAV